jgi:integrase
MNIFLQVSPAFGQIEELFSDGHTLAAVAMALGELDSHVHLLCRKHDVLPNGGLETMPFTIRTSILFHAKFIGTAKRNQLNRIYSGLTRSMRAGAAGPDDARILIASAAGLIADAPNPPEGNGRAHGPVPKTARTSIISSKKKKTVKTVMEYLTKVYLFERPNLTQKAYMQMVYAVRSFDAWHGSPVMLKNLENHLLIGWMQDMLAAGRSPVTCNKKRGAVLAIWNAAIEDDLAPFRKKKIPKLHVPIRIPVVWTLAEFERLLAATDLITGYWDGVPRATCWKIALLITWDTGLRRDAILNAKLADVDFNLGTLFVRAENIKGRKADRIFKLHPQTVAIIRESATAPRENLSPFPSSGKHVHRLFHELLLLAGLPADRWHQFHCIRRSTESYAAASKGIEWAANVVGHDVDVARRFYVNQSIAPRASLIEAIPRPQVITVESTPL